MPNRLVEMVRPVFVDQVMPLQPRAEQKKTAQNDREQPQTQERSALAGSKAFDAKCIVKLLESKQIVKKTAYPALRVASAR